jgi:TorA maturation chaperone TorD
VAKARSNIYGFLSRVYGQEATNEVFEYLKTPAVIAALHETGFSLGSAFFEIPQAQLLTDLAIEYTRLFIGPGKHIPPYESVHTHAGGLLCGEAAVAVKGFIESTGFEYQSDYQDMPDHISVELEFMNMLTDQEAQMWMKEDHDMALRCLRAEITFIDQHLARWVPQFCNCIIEGQESHFYACMAGLTRDFLETEKEAIPIQISEITSSM